MKLSTVRNKMNKWLASDQPEEYINWLGWYSLSQPLRGIEIKAKTEKQLSYAVDLLLAWQGDRSEYISSYLLAHPEHADIVYDIMDKLPENADNIINIFSRKSKIIKEEYYTVTSVATDITHHHCARTSNPVADVAMIVDYFRSL